jgi:hypothetical protein
VVAAIGGVAVLLVRPATPQLRFMAMLIAVGWPLAILLMIVAASAALSLTELIVNYILLRIERKQFSLRGLMALIALVALAMLAWNQIIRPQRERHQFIDAVASLGGGSSAQATEQAISVSLSGNRLGRGNKITDEGLALLASLPGRREVWRIHLFGCDITDDGLSLLRRFPELSVVVVNECPRVTDKGLDHFPAISKLSELDVAQCPQISEQAAARFTAIHGSRTIQIRTVRKLRF